MRAQPEPLDGVLVERGRRALAELLARAGEPSPAEFAGACALVMRLFVALLGEARGLRPVDRRMDAVGDQPPDSVARVVATLTDSLTPPELATLGSEIIGVVYEALLGAARKGAGSFYTPAPLSVPTVERTLEPLIRGDDGRVRPPAQLLNLKLCDPAMGSGNFLLAALRVLTTAVRESSPTPEPDVAIRRRVAERCLHGVDLDPIAVELARATLWLEVGDPTLDPELLATKLRCGDALLGAWSEQHREFPLLALCRERPGTDGARRALARRRTAVIQDQIDLLEGRAVPLEQTGDVRDAFDTWCALWFWPLDRSELIPLPSELARPSDAARAIVAELRARLRFCHWELEFPDVFAGANPGFDAILGNPPWDAQKPNSKEFFASYEPRYRSYAKQQALRVQAQLFARDPAIEAAWRSYSREFIDRGHYVRHAAEPFGDERSVAPVSLARGERGLAHHRRWRERRAQAQGGVEPERPFRQQGAADLNLYKMFIELGYALLRDGGQLGMIVPSGIYTDKGTAKLRQLLLRRCRWRWLYGFENRAGVFAIHRNFKFCVIIAEKRGVTESIQAAFMRQDLDDWPAARAALRYPAARISSYCPNSRSILEIQSERDLVVLDKLYAGGVLLGPRGWGLRYATEFHTTNDSSLFVGRDRAEAAGFRRDVYGRWISATGEVLLPLYEGRMLGQFDFSEKAWISGTGRSAVWRRVAAGAKTIAPQYVIPRADAAASKLIVGPKIAYMRIASATNTRTVIATYLRDVPAGDSVFFFVPERRPIETALAGVALFNSFVYDFSVRARLGGLNLSEFLMLETPLVAELPDAAVRSSLALAGASPWFAREWCALGFSRARAWQRHWAVSRHERLRLRCMLDAIIAVYYGLERADLTWILRDCDLPRELVGDQAFCRQLDPKGFWRVDRSEPPELRHGVLTLAAFDDLTRAIAEAGDREAGVQNFHEGLDGEGWQVPERLCLASLGLVRSVPAPAHARVLVPVRDRLGPRFFAWQLGETPAQSWAGCERHADAIRKLA